jgi:hypothetical protein
VVSVPLNGRFARRRSADLRARARAGPEIRAPMEQASKSERTAPNQFDKRGPCVRRKVPKAFHKFSYLRWIPTYVWQRLTRREHHGPVHLIIALADHFEPAIVPADGRARAPYSEQQRRVEMWCSEYPRIAQQYRDKSGRPIVHTYFYPGEQYDYDLVEQIADHCRSGWGELEVHLHHGVDIPATEASTRSQLVKFRDALACEHGCLSYLDGAGPPRYAFIHGNFALANAAGGFGCGVDNEIEILAGTGCYADLTLPAAAFHRAQIRKINSLYECALPLNRRAPHTRGHNLRSGKPPQIFPLIVQGPLLLDFDHSARNGLGRFETAALTDANLPSMRRLQLWKKAAIRVEGRPEWLFIKLHCHSMFPNHRDAVLGDSFQYFLKELVSGAEKRQESLHFVTAREMVNIIWAACDGRSGDPDQYRDYRLKLAPAVGISVQSKVSSSMGLKG